MILEDISFQHARQLALDAVSLLPAVEKSLEEMVGHVLAEDLRALVDCPSCSTSRKEGFAVTSSDVASATPERPVRLKLLGQATAGSRRGREVKPGCTVEVMTGAPIPAGAQAVLASEFARRQGQEIWCFRDASPGRNILQKGADIRAGEVVARQGRVLTPSVVGLLAAAGIERARVHPYPRVSVITTGDEIVLPGHPLERGFVYASNMVTLMCWLKRFGLFGHAQVAKDSKDRLRQAIERHLEDSQAIITSGGAWRGERDLVVSAFEELGWQAVFRRVRMAPGKATSMGLLQGKPVFCLPGSPPSTEMAFLQIVLPALLAMAGVRHSPFPQVEARLLHSLRGEPNWTRFFQARVLQKHGERWVEPLTYKSRLKAMAENQAVIRLEEGCAEISPGDSIQVQLINQSKHG